MSQFDPISENNPTPDTGQEIDIKAWHGDPEIPPTPGMSGFPPSEIHHHFAYKAEKDWWDKAKPIVEIGGVVLLAIYTGYTIKMYCANKEAANAATSAARVARDTLEITQRQLQASFVFTPSLRLDRKSVQLHIQNQGKMNAVVEAWTSDMEIQSIVTGAIIRRESRFWRVDSAITPGSDGARLLTIDWVANDAARIEDYLGRQIITLRIYLAYDSGFGRRAEQSFCRVLVADEIPNGKGRPLYFEPPECGEDAAYYIRTRRAQLGLPALVPYETPR